MGRRLTVTKDGVLTEEYGYDDFGRRGWRLGVEAGVGPGEHSEF